MLKKLTLLLIIFITAFTCGIFYLFNQIDSVYNKTNIELSKEFEVKDGMTAKNMGITLQENGIIKNSLVFYAFARYPKIASIVTKEKSEIFTVKKGFYKLSSKMNLVEVFKEISTGKEKNILISIPEGLTISKIARKLEEAELCNSKEFIKIASTEGKSIFKECGLNINSDSVEGFLYPDTYNIPVSYNSRKIIVHMVKNFIKVISSDEQTKKFLSLSDKDFYNTIILASIVEREYRVKDEASSIAGVFTNRLKINMALQSCATVEYIITEIQNKPHPKIITYSDLEIKNPFNTYIYNGLPPKPISNPGLTSLKAAINPEVNDYLYFTLTDAEAGRHTFSKDLMSHNKATSEFRTKRVLN